MMGGLSERELPRWVVVSAAVAGLVALVYFGGKFITGHAADPAPPRKVYPGMYNLRAEAARMRAAQQNAPRPNGQ
jgi:hypothetical protein